MEKQAIPMWDNIFAKAEKKTLEISKGGFDVTCVLCEKTFGKTVHHASTNSCSKNLGLH